MTAITPEMIKAGVDAYCCCRADEQVQSDEDIVAEIYAAMRLALDRHMPFPIFTLGPEGETQYQTYHRGFRDGWKAGEPTA
jgi:hypothetical protein